MRLVETVWLSVVVALVGCGGGLQVTMVQSGFARPSNVAVFFTVDTAGGDPVPGLQATDFRIYEDGSIVSVDESRQTIINPEVAAEHYTLLLVDMSGSVSESDQVPLIVQAVHDFSGQVEQYQKVAIYAFDGAEEIHPIVPFSNSRGGAAAGANALGSFHPRDPSTNLNGAIVQGVQVLDDALEHSQVPLHFATLVVFTDGTDHAARVSADDMSAALDEAKYDVFAIGVGNELDEHILGRIGRSGYRRVEDAAGVQQAFTEIGQRIVGYTQRYYLLSYCSPARAGQHEVTIEAVTPDASGEVTYQFDAAGFGPDCDPARPPRMELPTQLQHGRHRGGASVRAGVHVQGRATVGAGAGAGGGGDNPEEGLH